MKRLVYAITFIVVLAGLAGFYLWSYYQTPAAHEGDGQVISIPPGDSVGQIATRLANAGLIRHRRAFIAYVTWLRPGPHLKAGEYELSPTLSPAQITTLLRAGKSVHHVLTIPEGIAIRDLAKLVGETGFGEPTGINTLAQDAAFIASLGLIVTSLEGYLFPDTYHLPRPIEARALLTLMVHTLQSHYTDDIAARAKQLNLSQHEVLTLASLIEKEAQLDTERPLISAVYHNRLKRRMRLQCDPTVIYALGDSYNGNIRKQDLNIDSPYNTYRYRGLPPGPIANSGRRSIAAAVSPAEVDYLYFVATGKDGEHYFSKTLKEHNRAVRKYQLRQADAK